MGKKQRVIERLKTLLILVLVCSAVALIIRSQMFDQWPGVLGQTQPSGNNTATATSQAQAALPLRMAVTNETGCFGVQYGNADLEELFRRTAPLLNEALSGADAPVPVSRDVWERALLSSPSIYFDFQGRIPMRVLAGWLSGKENDNLTAMARHLILAADGGDVRLYYLDEDSGQYWVCSADLISLSRLQSAVSDITGNDAFFACQSEAYKDLAPYTMLSAYTPQPAEYAVSNPMHTEQEQRLTALLEGLSFPVGITSVYDTPEGRRARSGNDTLSISDDGVVVYHTTDGGQRYPVTYPEGSGALYAAVESARQLVQGVLGQWYGAARLYLSKVEELGADSWRVEFGYVLNGTPVQVGQRGCAASVVISKDHITEYELQLRSYAMLNQMTQILPEEQAVAILTHLGQQGGQLQLCYQDNGDTARAGWVVWQ